MVTVKLNRAMAQLCHLNPDMYKVIIDLWRNKIGTQNLFKLKFCLTYLISYLEEYLDLCEKRFQQLEKGLITGEGKNIYITQLQAALEGFVRMKDDSNLNKSKFTETTDMSES